MTDKLFITKNGIDVTEGIELRNGKANGFGWSTYEVWATEMGGETMVEHKIAEIYCGQPKNFVAGYGFRIESS